MNLASESIRTIVVHKNCPDGIASALILKDAIPAANVIEVAYDLERDELPATTGMLFCDMTPPESRVAEFLEVGAFVLDHHKTAKALVQAFGARGVYAGEDTDPGVSGAVLAYREFWVDASSSTSDRANVEWFARMAGIRDTWQRKSLDWIQACKQGEVLQFLGLEKALGLGLTGVLQLQGWLGDHLWERKMKRARQAADGAWKVRVGGLLVAMVPGVGLISDAADLIDADISLEFFYAPDGDGRSLHVSLRSRDRVDVGKLARELGGGGHAGAAGFRIPVFTNSLNPYSEIMASISSVQEK